MVRKVSKITLHHKLLFAVAGNGSSNVARALVEKPCTNMEMDLRRKRWLTSRNCSIWFVSAEGGREEEGPRGRAGRGGRGGPVNLPKMSRTMPHV